MNAAIVTNVVAVVILLALVAGVLSQAIYVVREYQRIVVFRLGKCIGERGPGPILLVPFVDKPVLVDLRELFIEVPHQACITRDNVSLKIDFLVFRQVVDSVTSVVAITDFGTASQGIAATTLRAVIGDINLDDLLAQRQRINQDLRRKLDEVTQRWGVKVTAVEIREVVPPHDVEEAMNRQMSAERTRRAAVTAAEGDRQASILKADGYAQALQTVFNVARQVDAKTMTIQVIEGLKAIGSGPSNTFVIPMELTRMLGQIGTYLEWSQAGDLGSTDRVVVTGESAEPVLAH
jgi:regulator of protease activity HflC (stomatin/prohibitin superfamily)